MDNTKRFNLGQRFFVLFLLFKIFLSFLYFVSGYQHFSVQAVLLLLRVMLLNDSVLIVFSGFIIFYALSIYQHNIPKIAVMIVGIVTLLACLMTSFLSVVVLSFSVM